jgi:hypothetical protein
MLASKALSQGVPRLSIADVADLLIPIGPWPILELEYKKYNEWKQDVNLALDYANKAHLIGLLAFNDNHKGRSN